VVVLQFRAQSQTKPVPDELDFVLHKAAVEGRGPASRIESNGEGIVQFIRRYVIAHSQNQVLPIAHLEVVLQVQVEGVAALREDYSVAPGVVIVSFERKVRRLRELVVPPSQNIPPDYVDLVA